MATAVQTLRTKFGPITVTPAGTGQTLIHKMANWMWLPMILMGMMAIATAIGLGIAQASVGSDLGAEFTALRRANFETLGHLIPGFMFLGFAMIFAGISFAIARILGVFRTGGGLVQEAVGEGIKTLVMPRTAWIFLVGMMMAMMILIFTFAGHIYAAVQAHEAWISAAGPDAPNEVFLGRAETWATWLEGLRRFGVGLYLASITFGLATIIEVIRFQTLRIKELAQQRLAGA